MKPVIRRRHQLINQPVESLLPEVQVPNQLPIPCLIGHFTPLDIIVLFSVKRLHIEIETVFLVNPIGHFLPSVLLAFANGAVAKRGLSLVAEAGKYLVLLILKLPRISNCQFLFFFLNQYRITFRILRDGAFLLRSELALE